jgi:hypothetical protein
VGFLAAFCIFFLHFAFGWELVLGFIPCQWGMLTRCGWGVTTGLVGGMDGMNAMEVEGQGQVLRVWVT